MAKNLGNPTQIPNVSRRQAGEVQLWGLEAGTLLEALYVPEPVTAVTLLSQEPYLLLGCSDGGIRVAELRYKSEAPAIGVCQARGLALLPYDSALSHLTNYCEDIQGPSFVVRVSQITLLMTSYYSIRLTLHKFRDIPVHRLLIYYEI